jgi:hypothetical protein
MEIQVYYNENTRGEIPYTSLPAFRLLCEQNGLQVRWNAEEKTLRLNPGLTGIKIFLASDLNEAGVSSKKEQKYEHEVMKKTKEFLRESGADVTLLYDHSLTPSYGDLYIRIRFSFLKDGSIKRPEITLYYDWNLNNKKLLYYLEEQLQSAEIGFIARKRPRISMNMPMLELECQLPNLEQALFDSFIEEISINLASVILLYFQDFRQIPLLSCLPLHALEKFIYEYRNNQISSVSQIQSMKQEDTALSEPETKEEPNASEVEHIEVQESAVGVKAARMQAEVFFDYIVLPSEREESSYLVMGNLYIKNTGTETLYNPVICLKATPADRVKLQGQILPANMIETLGTQSSEGIKGWRYLQKDWFAEALERGEYWIAPVQHFEITPEEVQAFHSFQLSILKPEEISTVTIEGFVYFKELEVPFASNNSIVFSF